MSSNEFQWILIILPTTKVLEIRLPLDRRSTPFSPDVGIQPGPGIKNQDYCGHLVGTNGGLLGIFMGFHGY